MAAQVVMDQGVAVNALECRAGAQGMSAVDTEQPRAFGDEKRSQPLALTERGVAHGVDHRACIGAVEREKVGHDALDLRRCVFQRALKPHIFAHMLGRYSR